jgi:amino acid adenylation domain-containing protein
MQLESFLESGVRRTPTKTAVIVDDLQWTYAEVNMLCDGFAAKLAAGGVRRWDRVVLCLENSVEMVVAIFGTLKLGAVFVPVNPTTKPEKLAFILRDSEARCLIADSQKLSLMKDMPEGTSAISKSEVLCSRSGAPPRQSGIDMDLAALLYTSGSTGRPKGVMLTHRNMVSTATSISTYLENTADDIILNALPLAFGYGLYQLLTAFLAGATLVLERSFTYPGGLLDRLAKERVTGIPIVPTIASILLQMQIDRWDLSRLRYITNAGAALPLEHISKIRRLFPNAKLYSMYGLTECQRASYLAPDQIDIRPASVGKGMPNEEVYIVNEQGEPVGPDVVGELVIRGANVMQGYWRNPEATAGALRTGRFPWERVLYSGDLFRADEEGFLYFIGRKDEIIKSRGQKVSPREVEDVLYTLPGIAEAAVVGVPDPVLGSAIRAIVVLYPGQSLTERDVLSHCARRLEDFAVPKSVEFRTSLPRTTTGKIWKRELVHPEEAVA